MKMQEQSSLVRLLIALANIYDLKDMVIVVDIKQEPVVAHAVTVLRDGGRVEFDGPVPTGFPGQRIDGLLHPTGEVGRKVEEGLFSPAGKDRAVHLKSLLAKDLLGRYPFTLADLLASPKQLG